MPEHPEPLPPSPTVLRRRRGRVSLLVAVAAAVVVIAGAAVGVRLYAAGPGGSIGGGGGPLVLDCASVPARIDRSAFTTLHGTDIGGADPNTRECSLTGDLGGERMTLDLTVQRFATPAQAARAATARLDEHCGEADPRTPAGAGNGCMSLFSPQADRHTYVVESRGTLTATAAGPATGKPLSPEQLRSWYEELAKFTTAGLSLAR